MITISHAEFNRMVKEFHGKKVEKGKQSWLKLEPFRPKWEQIPFMNCLGDFHFSERLS